MKLISFALTLTSYRFFIFMPFKQLFKLPNYFISSAGYVIKISQGKEVIVRTYKTRRSKDVFVEIEKKHYNLLHLMVQHFHGDIKFNHSIKFKVDKDLRIPLSSIRIREAVGKNGLNKEDEAILYNFKCDLKANSSNSRCEQKLTAIDVFRTLSIHQFKCIYCLAELTPNTWHLDHFKAISTGGKNIIENIVPSCFVCNTMKGALEGDQFYTWCKKISNNYMFKDSIFLNYKPQTTAI